MPDDDGQQLPEGTDPPAAPTGRTFTQEEFNKALERERNKLYGRLEKGDERQKAMDEELKELRAAQQRRDKEDAKRQKEAEDAKRRADEAELSAKELIDRRQAEWEQQFAAQQEEWAGQVSTLQSQMQEQAALWEREREFQALAQYAREQVAAHADEIAPELIDFVGGNSQEEIDASIARVVEKTAQIVAGIRGAQTAGRAAMPGVSAAGFAPVGPIDQQGGQRQLTPEEIKAMPMPEYAKLRQQLGVSGNNIGSGKYPHLGKGLFG